MSERSVPERPPPENARIQGYARAFLNRDRLVLAIEDEIERLRTHRPQLESRLDRATGILTIQLSVRPRQRPVRVRVSSAGERARFLVNSLNHAGAVYEVHPEQWSCSCPDYHRRDAPCKHVLASYVLKRVAREAARPRKGCEVCTDGWVYLAEDVIDAESGEARTYHNPIRCRRCAPVEPPYLTDEELEEWMASVSWKYAKTMPRHPHEYTLRANQDEELFVRVCRTIWDLGYDRSYLNRPWRSLDIGDHYVWLHTRPEPRMPVPLENTELINRALRVQERLV